MSRSVLSTTRKMRPSIRLTCPSSNLMGTQLLPLLPGHFVHLLVYQSHQVFADVGLGEDVVPDGAIPNRSLPYPNRLSTRTALCRVD